MSKIQKIFIVLGVCLLLVGLFFLLYWLFGPKEATVGTTGLGVGLETVRRLKSSKDSNISNDSNIQNDPNVPKDVNIQNSNNDSNNIQELKPENNAEIVKPKTLEGLKEFTDVEKKVVKMIVNLWETGEIKGKYDLLVVLDDGAGITFGRSQTTENSGGIFRLLKKYEEMGGLYNFSKFKIYPEAKKFNLTNNKEFKDLLVLSARNDEIMRKCQDLYFDEHYFFPSLEICKHFNFVEPLSLHFVYDFCIQSGPGSKFKDGSAFDRMLRWDIQNLSEKEKVRMFCEKRHEFLGMINHAQKTRYRTQSILELMDSNKWKLEIPLTFTFFKKKYLGYEDKMIEITSEDLE